MAPSWKPTYHRVLMIFGYGIHRFEFVPVMYKGRTNRVRAISPVSSTSFVLRPYIFTLSDMQFLKSTIFFALTFLAFAVAASGTITPEAQKNLRAMGRWGGALVPIIAEAIAAFLV